MKKELDMCIKSSFVSTSGNHISKLSKELKKITGSKYILLTSSGTSALFCALKEIDVNNLEVIVPSMTFVATAYSVLYAGGSPVFIDNSDINLNIDDK